MTVILIFSLTTLEPLKDNDKSYPEIAYFIGRCITCLGLLQLPIFAIYAICKQKDDTLIEVGTNQFHSLHFNPMIYFQKIKSAFRPTSNWGPIDPTRLLQYKEFINKN